MPQYDRETMDNVKCDLILYVNAYSVQSLFGGPEEGGWWYDAYEPLASVPLDPDVTDAQIADEKARLVNIIGWESPRHGRRAAAGGSDFEIRVEHTVATSGPQQRPHYE